MQKALPAKTVKVDIKGNSYEVSFPNTGNFIDIQCLKNRITSDNYNVLVNSSDGYGAYARLLCDMIATYNIMIPELKKDINVQSILGLNMIESKILLDSYTKQYLPFFSEWMDIITNPNPEEETGKDAI